MKSEQDVQLRDQTAGQCYRQTLFSISHVSLCEQEVSAPKKENGGVGVGGE